MNLSWNKHEKCVHSLKYKKKSVHYFMGHTKKKRKAVLFVFKVTNREFFHFFSLSGYNNVNANKRGDDEEQKKNIIATSLNLNKNHSTIYTPNSVPTCT